MTVQRTDIKTTPAVDTELSVERDFRMKVDRLRIVTPEALEGTSFEENGCPNTGTVLNGEVLYIEDEPL